MLSPHLHVRKYDHLVGSYISQFPSSTRFADVTKRRNYFLSLSFQKLRDARSRVPGQTPPEFLQFSIDSREKKSGLEKYRFIILSIKRLLRRRKMLPYIIRKIIEIIIKKSKEKLKKIPSTLMVAFYFSLSATCTYTYPLSTVKAAIKSAFSLNPLH